MPQRNDAGHPNEIFADGVGWIGVHGGVVRIEFFSYGAPAAGDAPPGAAPGKAPEKEPERIPRQRIVMPIDAFIRSLGAMNDLVKKLEDGGMIMRRPAAAQTGGGAGGGAATPPSPASPNFG